jgi:hypothetical protein
MLPSTMASRAPRLVALLVAAAASLLLLACATAKPSRASQAHAALDMKGKRCSDCHPEGFGKKRPGGAAPGSSAPGGSAPAGAAPAGGQSGAF